MSYDKTNHALISRINPKINPTLKLGHSCLVAHGDSLQFEHDIELDEELSNYTCSFAVSSDELIVDNAGEINKLVTVAGAVFIPTPSGFRNVGVAMGIQLSESVGDFTHLSDDSVFYMEENGFAVKSNVLYPIKIDRSGYEGLSGTADKYFSRGLISRKGSIDIEAWNYLDTLIDFGSSTAVKATGLRISEMDGVDCNLELIYVAEPKLDPAEIAILVPSAGDEFKLDTNFTVSGTSNCANVKIEASADGINWTVLSASTAVTAGVYSKTNCQLPSATFNVNDPAIIKVSDVDAISQADTVTIGTLATIVITPAIGAQVAGVAFDVAGTANCSTVDILVGGAVVEADVEVTGGAFTQEITIADAADDVLIRVEDSDNEDAYDTETIDVASGSERYQILSENCDFITIDSCPVGTTKIAIAGNIYNMTGVVKLGGETIARGTTSNLAVLILYDIQTKMIDFIKTSSNLQNSVTAGSYVKILDADDTYIYWLKTQGGYRLEKITISDGTVAESSVFGTTVVSNASGKASMCADADYCYVIYPDYTDKRIVMGIRIAKSDLALGTATDLSFSPDEWTENQNNAVCTDGTYLYWVQNAGLLDTQVVRSSMTIASQSIVATYHAYDAGNPPLRTLPYNAVYANSKLYVSMNDDSPYQRWTYDGTNKAGVGGRLSLANGIILSSISGTLQKLSSSLSIDWNKDYAGDAVSGGGTVVYVGGKYYYVGYSSGDFDGNNPTNTKRCAIIGKIDITNGNL